MTDQNRAGTDKSRQLRLDMKKQDTRGRNMGQVTEDTGQHSTWGHMKRDSGHGKVDRVQRQGTEETGHERGDLGQATNAKGLIRTGQDRTGLAQARTGKRRFVYTIHSQHIVSGINYLVYNT